MAAILAHCRELLDFKTNYDVEFLKSKSNIVAVAKVATRYPNLHVFYYIPTCIVLPIASEMISIFQ